PASPFIMILHLHPPESPLFPYTTLFRSHRRRQPLQVGAVLVPVGGYSLAYQPPDADPRGCSARTSAADGRRPPHQAALCAPGGRSEEHTSELQSRENLVCRLLLEKKKRK